MVAPGRTRLNVRGAVNELIVGKLYQRSQILTWQRPAKLKLLADYGIDCVVNLWPKVDPDWWGMEPRVYLQLPAEPSTEVLSPAVREMARCVAMMLRGEQLKAALVLCEAGKTRSVFFSVLVYKYFHDVSGRDAQAAVVARVNGVSLKPSMITYLRDLA